MTWLLAGIAAAFLAGYLAGRVWGFGVGYRARVREELERRADVAKSRLRASETARRARAEREDNDF